MKSSWKVGRIAGVDVFVHATFLMLVGWIALSGYLRTGRIAAALAGVGLTLAVFAVVVLHELGHALAARRFGIRTRDITLWPIGGVARLERIPERPRDELLVALAGPAVNVVLAFAIWACLRALGTHVTALDQPLSHEMPFWTQLFWINVTLAAFNLVPAFPMDGGRALRALLGMRLDFVRATQIAARLGQTLAVLMGIVGLLYNPMLLFIALFVWMAAAAESALVLARSAMEGLPVQAAMLTRFGTLQARDTLGTAARQLLAGSDTDFPVLQQGEVIGVLTRNGLIKGLAELGPDACVLEAMQRRFALAHPAEMLDLALARSEGLECQVLPVLDDEGLVGLITPENVAEVLMLRTVAERSSRREGSRRSRSAAVGTGHGLAAGARP